MNTRRHLWLVALATGVVAPRAGAAESVVIDSATHCQTIRSWDAPAGLLANRDVLLHPLLDELVDTLGFTRLRFEPPRREWVGGCDERRR